MAWWVIVLVLIAAFGPILWILPSRRDRLLTSLRAGARRRGLLVELTQLPDLDAPPEARVSAGGQRRDPVISCTAYRQPLPRSVNHAPHWRLLASADGAGPVAGWVFDGAAAGGEAYWKRGKERLSRVPDAVIGVEAERNQVGVFWRERVSVEQIESILDSLVDALQGLADWQQDVEREALARLSGAPEEPD